MAGPEAKTRVWMVLDRSKPDAPYDVLYADLNANGDLREAEERIAGETEWIAGGGANARFALPDFKDPATGDKHTQFRLEIYHNSGRPMYMLELKWKGTLPMRGGYPEDGTAGYMRFAESAKEAPIIWFNGDGPLRFQRWYSDRLRIGKEDDLRLFLGQQGVGRSTFCAFSTHVLPEGEVIHATLIYSNTAGKQQHKRVELKERC